MTNSPIARTQEKGFTIVETLVAITILMIAIAGPLVVANKGLIGATTSKNQLIATYLASESLEDLKNIRDNNLYTGASWLNGISTAAGAPCTSRSSQCDASTLQGVSSCGASLCAIDLDPTYGYVHSGGSATAFKRGYYIHAPGSTASCASSDECAVTVEVDWNEGVTPYAITVTSELTSTLR